MKKPSAKKVPISDAKLRTILQHVARRLDRLDARIAAVEREDAEGLRSDVEALDGRVGALEAQVEGD